jgi:hypothetical protein
MAVAKRSMPRSFYCIVHGRDNEWEGLCLDLDVAVHGHSFNEVKSLMSEAICSYVEDALKESEPSRSALLNRRAPLRVRLYWAMRIVWAALRRRRQDEDLPVGYPELCRV